MQNGRRIAGAHSLAIVRACDGYCVSSTVMVRTAGDPPSRLPSETPSPLTMMVTGPSAVIQPVRSIGTATPASIQALEAPYVPHAVVGFE